MRNFKERLLLVVVVISFFIGGCNMENAPDCQRNTASEPASNINDLQYTVIAQTDAYDLCCYQSQYFIKPNISLSTGSENMDNTGSQMIKHVPTFSSIEELKEAILTGDFTKEDLQSIVQYFPKDELGNILICNPNLLVNASLPDGVTLQKVTWSGLSYGFEFSYKEAIGGITVCTENQYTEMLEKYHTKFYENERVTLVSDEIVADRNARVCHYSTSLGEFKNIHYTYTCGDRTLMICECYRPTYSETAPSMIQFVGTQGSLYFFGSIFYLDSRPSFEWLQAFGLTALDTGK